MRNRWLGKTTRFVTFFCAAMLAACGGGGDGVGSGGFLGDQPPPGTEVPPAYLVELETTDGSGTATKRFTSQDPLTVTVSLFEVDGEVLTPVVDEIINLESSLGSVDPSNGSTLTDANGQAIFLLTAGENEIGAGTVTATFNSEDEETFTRSQNIEALPATSGGSTSLALELFDAAGNATTRITPDEPVTARVTLSSQVENFGVANRIVSLESGIATVSPDNGSTLTNDEGVAEFLLTFGGTLGAGTVTASFSTADLSLLATTVLESTSLELEQGLTLTLLDASGNASNTLTESSPLTVQVALTDAEGTVQDIDDEIITLSSDLGSISPDNGSALTDNGIAEFTLRFDGSVGAGEVKATYETEQGTLEQTATIESQAEGVSNYVLSISRSGGAVTPTNPVTVTVNLRADSASGPAVAGELVSLSSDVTDVSPGNGTVVTNSSGNATFTLGFNGTEGAGVVEASYTSEEGNTFSNSINVTASQGTPLYSLDIQQASGTQFDETGVAISVRLTSSSGSVANQVVALSTEVGLIEPDNKQDLTDALGNAGFTLTGDGSTGAGVVTASFTDADGNVYEDSISVYMFTSGTGGGGTDPSKMTFVSADPETIALRGSGGGTGLSEQSVVTFKITDSSDVGVPGQVVTFNLSTSLGGVSFDRDSAVTQTTGTTDANGEVIVTVYSGTLPTPVRVTATFGDFIVLSDTLNVSSGIPVANRFNLYRSSAACSGATSVAGSECPIQIAAFDRFGNPVVDGTVVNVVTNCGGVGQDSASTPGSCVFGSDGFGRCEVQWVAPEGMQGANTCPDGSPVQVMGYTLGEESFDDADADGYFSAGNPFTDLGEPFLDEDGMGYNPPDFFVDWNSTGVREGNTGNKSDAASTLYNGTACDENQGNPAPVPGTDCSKELIFVFDTVDPTQ